MLYNDAGLPIIGAKHPDDLGQSIKVALKEAWSILRPLVEGVITTGEAVYLENLLIPLERLGFVQDGYYTFSYLPIRNEAADVGGIFVVVMETTRQVKSRAALASQSEFEKQLIGIVSHDLRNPLNTILLASEVLSEIDELGADAAPTVARIQSAAEGAARLVRDLLDFTQARLGGGIHIEPRAASFHALARAALEEAAAPSRSHRFEVLQEGDGQGEADRRRAPRLGRGAVDRGRGHQVHRHDAASFEAVSVTAAGRTGRPWP
jgi:signal transduction histidine kinase